MVGDVNNGGQLTDVNVASRSAAQAAWRPGAGYDFMRGV